MGSKPPLFSSRAFSSRAIAKKIKALFFSNKIKKIRAAVFYNLNSTRLSRQHNNANIISLGSRLTKKKLSLKLVDIFLSTKFEGGRHLRRVKKI